LALEITKSIIIGLAFGGAVGLFNHWLVWSASKENEGETPRQVQNRVMGRYLIRYFINILTMATYLWHKDMYLLAGTAVGLTVLGKALAVNQTFGKKGVK